MVEKLQELRSIRIQKLKKQGVCSCDLTSSRFTISLGFTSYFDVHMGMRSLESESFALSLHFSPMTAYYFIFHSRTVSSRGG